MIKKHLSFILLGTALLIVSILSLFIGVMDIDLKALLSGGNGMELNIFLLTRVPRLLAILCTGVGMSVAGLIMQQLCMNKFVSPSTGATIQSAQFGILLSLVFLPAIGLWGRILLSFTMAILGTWIFVGSFALIIKGSYELVWLAVPLVILAFIFANYFNIVGMGKDFSQNLGVDYDRTVRRLLLGVVLCIAVATAMVGPISFLGLIIANLARQFLKTYRHGQLIVGSALMGMLAIIAGQLISQHVFNYAVPISTFITIGGGIYFLYLLLFQKGGI